MTHMLSGKLAATYGKDFMLSQNWIAFWDRLERANVVLDKMIKYRDLNPMDPKILYYLHKYFQEGGEFEFCKNIIEKYGIVPCYAMPETKCSGDSSGYILELQELLNEGAGYLHKRASEGAEDDELLQIKEKVLEGIRNFLVCFLGEPPKQFLIKKGDRKKVVQAFLESGLDEQSGAISSSDHKVKTPLSFYKECGVDLNDYIHLSNLP